MFAVSSAAQAIRAQRRASYEPAMIWIEARHRETGAVEGIGLWQGGDIEDITVTDMFTGMAVTRTFYHQAMLSIEWRRMETGIAVGSTRIRISRLSPAARNAFHLYDPRGAQAQLWVRSYDPDTMLPIAVEPRDKGYINLAPETRPVPGGEGVIEAEIVSSARLLTITSALRKSDEVQRRRGGDKFRQYKATQASKDVPWAVKGSAR